MQKKKDFLILAGYWAALAAIGYLCVKYLLGYLLPFLLAFCIAGGCEKGILFLRRKLHLKRSFLAAVITLALTGGFAALLAVVISALLRQAVSFLAELPLYLQQMPRVSDEILRRLESFCTSCGTDVQPWLQKGINSLTSQLGTWLGKLSGRCLQAVTTAVARLPRAALFTVTAALAVYFTVGSYPRIRAFFRRQFSDARLKSIREFRDGTVTSVKQWLRAQLLLLAITFAQLLAGLSLLRIPYALLIAAVTALIDALPVFGSGIVLLPWAVLCFCSGAMPRGLALVTIYAVVTLVHNIAAPKLMAAQSGLPPLVSLVALYVGFCVGGVWGMLIGPVLAMLLYQFRQNGLLRLWK